MLRIHFTTDDLMRISISAEPHPLWEVLLSLHLLQTDQGVLDFDPWRHDVRKVLKPSVVMLTKLARPKGYSPDFLTPAGGTNLESGIDALLSTGRRELRTDIVKMASETTIPGWVASIADGSSSALKQLTSSIRSYYADALEPHWQTIRAHIHADYNRRARLATDCGFESLLQTLNPAIKWRSPVLEVAYPVDQDIHLEGRGLVLTPSFFCWQNPITFADPGKPPILIYPVERELGWTTAHPPLSNGQPFSPRPESLATLLGRTRAAVLRTIADTSQVNTSELANTIGMSLASASQHATVLRDAGLVITDRRNGSAQHKLSSRGACLLNGLVLPGFSPASNGPSQHASQGTGT